MCASFADRKQSLEELIEACRTEDTGARNTSVALLAQGIADLIVHSTLEGKQHIEAKREKLEQIARPIDAPQREAHNTLVRNTRSIPIADALSNASAWLAVLKPSQPTPKTAQAWKDMLSLLRTQSLTSLCAADLQEVCAFFQEAKATSITKSNVHTKEGGLIGTFPSLLARARYERVLSLALVQYQAMLDRETAQGTSNVAMLSKLSQADQEMLNEAKQAFGEPEILDID
jgi:hypothetical protein